MDIKEFKKYTNNLHEYSAQDIDDFEFMTNEELESYQREIDFDTGNLSCWDHVRATFTYKKQIADLNRQVSELIGAIYEHANEGTELMELAERIDSE